MMIDVYPCINKSDDDDDDDDNDDNDDDQGRENYLIRQHEQGIQITMQNAQVVTDRSRLYTTSSPVDRS